MSTKMRYEALQARLGYRFDDLGLLAEALRHPSSTGTNARDNQRLEFLGDRVLGLVIAEALFRGDHAAREGELAPRFNHLVRKETCARIAANLALGDEVVVGRSETMSGGRKKLALLGDAIEAVIAAIYLDGGFTAAQRVILDHWSIPLKEMPQETVDAKTRLQEWVQARGEGTPEYVLTKRTGPDHSPEFEIEVRLASGAKARAKATSKRRAEQSAAAILLNEVRGHD